MVRLLSMGIEIFSSVIFVIPAVFILQYVHICQSERKYLQYFDKERQGKPHQSGSPQRAVFFPDGRHDKS